MKHYLLKPVIIFSLTIATANLFTGCNSKPSAEGEDGKLEGTISLSGAFALYPLAVIWGEEFKKLHPEVRVEVSAGGAGKGMVDALSGNVDLGMISRDINPQEAEKGAWPISVTKDAVIPTINASNPELPTILKKGLTQQNFTDIWIGGKIKTWGEVTGSGSKESLQAYTRSDAGGAAETWAKYLGGKKQEDLGGVGVFGDPGLAEAVKKDKSGIGYNNIAYVYNNATKQPNEGIRPIPIDINANGAIDPEENFYDNVDSLTKAIAKGVFPSPPARELYLVSNGKPKSKLVQEFLKWVLTDGQKQVEAAGYVKLQDEKITAELEKLK